MLRQGYKYLQSFLDNDLPERNIPFTYLLIEESHAHIRKACRQKNKHNKLNIYTNTRRKANITLNEFMNEFNRYIITYRSLSDSSDDGEDTRQPLDSSSTSYSDFNNYFGPGRSDYRVVPVDADNCIAREHDLLYESPQTYEDVRTQIKKP